LRIALILGVLGNLLRVFSLAFLPPLILALVDGELIVAKHFAISLGISVVLGSILARTFEPARLLRRPEALAVVSGAWLVVAAAGGVPYVLHGLSPVDAFFESMSGFTTTGATILTDFDAPGRAFFLWRAMSQWFGGLGVIALFVIVLPQLGIAGRQLFFAEASGAPSEGISPQVRTASRKLWILYTGLTALLALLLMATGFDWYEGLVHALTTLSAGGFSPSGTSIEGYANPAAEWVLIVFMVISGTSYTLQYRAVTGRPGALVRDGEFVAYFLFSLFAALGLSWMLAGGGLDLDALRRAAFQITSLASSTGYASENYQLWGQGEKAFLVLAMLVGGCAGSACGGPKVVRWLILGKFLRREMTEALHPRAIIPLRYKHHHITSSVMRAVLSLIVVYVIGYLVIALAVIWLDGCTMEEGFTAAMACLGNIGPGFGRAGPMDNFAFFSDSAKLVLSAGMWFGRLEIVSVLALLNFDAWRGTRWSGADRTSSRLRARRAAGGGT
jgi:trk system potassium uptake protein TrkH